MTVMPYQDIKRSIVARIPMISSENNLLPVEEKQVQPASFDLRLGTMAYGVRHASLPHGRRVEELVQDPRNRWCEFELGLEKVNPVPPRQPYLIKLAESFNLPPETYAEFSPKSSTGRCDVLVRVLCNKFSGYDKTPVGYRGPLWLEMTSLSHEIGIKAGLALVQARFKKDETKRLSETEVVSYHRAEGILFDQSGQPLLDLDAPHGELAMHVDLDREVAGFVSKDTTHGMLDMTVSEQLDPLDFWEPIRGPKNKDLIIMPGKFYLLATEERIRIPPGVCGHLLSSMPTMGDLRIHYAGFFDNGFGGESGTHGVLEVRGRDVPFKIEHNKPVGAMVFERTSSVPEQLYQGNYKDHRPSLSKHFRSRWDAWTGEYLRMVQ